MQAGKLRHRVKIQMRSSSSDTHGQQLTTWSDLATVSAAIDPLNGRELFAAQAVNSEVTHKITMRFQNGFSSANRVNFDGRIFNIHAILDDGERHKSLTLHCSEGLNDG